MNRRNTVVSLLALLAAPLAAGALLSASSSLLAQPALKAPRIALVDSAEQPTNMVEGRHPLWGALLAELHRLGYVEGKTITIERWSGGGDTAGYGELVRKIAASQPQIIVARGRTITSPLAAATTEIPIVSVGSISAELRASLARPGGNLTGLHVSADEQQIYGKQMDLLRELTTSGARVAWLGPQSIWDGPTGEGARQGAKRSNLALEPVFIANPIDANTIGRAFAVVRSGKFEGLLISPATELFPHRAAIAKLALETRLPSVANTIAMVEAGVLASYGSVTEDLFRRAAHYVDRILKGTKPGELPIEQPTKIHLVLNLKTAKALGLVVPKLLHMRADRVIE